jgi:protoporphyrinogen oxidase
MFGYVTGGYATVHDRFAGKLAASGVTLRPGTPVRTIGRSGTKFDVAGEDYDRVVITAASPVAAKLCPLFTDAERACLNGIRYQGIVCASVVLTKPLAHYYVTNITEPMPFTAVIEMTALVDPAEFGGRHLVYLPKYVDPSDPLFDASEATIRESFLAALATMYPHFTMDDVLAFRVSRVRHVLAISTLNYSELMPPMIASVPGLFVVNSSQIANGTLNVNETLLLADRGAKAVQA